MAGNICASRKIIYGRISHARRHDNFFYVNTQLNLSNKYGSADTIAAHLTLSQAILACMVSEL